MDIRCWSAENIFLSFHPALSFNPEAKLFNFETITEVCAYFELRSWEINHSINHNQMHKITWDRMIITLVANVTLSLWNEAVNLTCALWYSWKHKIAEGLHLVFFVVHFALTHLMFLYFRWRLLRELPLLCAVCMVLATPVDLVLQPSVSSEEQY